MKKIENYIMNAYEVDTPIFNKDLQKKFADVNSNTIRQTLKRLCDAEIIQRAERGIYFKPNPNRYFKQAVLSLEKIIQQKYLQTEKEIVGYRGGLGFANKLGLTTQVPSIETIFSNNVCNKKREIRIKNVRVILQAPKIQITNKNYKILQVLDLMQNIEIYSDYNFTQSTNKINSYLSDVILSFDEMEKIISKYPLKSQINFYKLGVFYEITHREGSVQRNH